MTSEVDASVENSNFEKCKSRRFVRSIRSLCSILIEKQEFETSNKKEFRLREVLYFQIPKIKNSQNDRQKQRHGSKKT